MKSLTLQKNKRKLMNTTRLKSELHQIIDRVTDGRILQAVHTILSSQTNIQAYSSSGLPLTKQAMDGMLEASEGEMQDGKK
ncbi:MAG: hypothetical protein U5K79_00005 [Cyclobacteriaceae bacterium]|nr:hypothetical protein [Cyclobacteriaceae bacterium]